MSRALSIILLVTTLALAACGGDGDTASDGSPEPTAAGTAPTGTATGADLPDGVAAEVGDVTIDAARVDERGAAALEDPQLSGQLPEDPEEAESLVRASVLGQMIVTEAVLQAAEAEGIEVTDEDVDAKREELEQQAGGAEALEEQIDTLGFDEAELDRQFRSLAVLDAVAEQDAPDGAPTEDSTAPAQPDPGQMAVQQWLTEQVASIEIVVDGDYGSWDAQSLQVIPPGGMPRPAAPPPQTAPPTAPPDS